MALTSRAAHPGLGPAGVEGRCQQISTEILSTKPRRKYNGAGRKSEVTFCRDAELVKTGSLPTLSRGATPCSRMRQAQGAEFIRLGGVYHTVSPYLLTDSDAPRAEHRCSPS